MTKSEPTRAGPNLYENLRWNLSSLMRERLPRFFVNHIPRGPKRTFPFTNALASRGKRLHLR